MPESALPLGPGLHVFERGWLSSNNILLDDGDGAALVDSGHCVHAAQTVALLRQQLGPRPLRRLINTHLHSDHCGGNAALQREWPLQLQVPSGSWHAVQDWDTQALSHRPTGQRCERFHAQGRISAGERLRIGFADHNGHPYRSLGIAVNRGFGPDFLIGGTYMLAASAEVRARVTETIGIVGFVDAGSIGVNDFFGDLGDWHAGAGLGLRYETGFGPIRLDVAAPIHGKTGDGVQIYIGLGQSF